MRHISIEIGKDMNIILKKALFISLLVPAVFSGFVQAVGTPNPSVDYIFGQMCLGAGITSGTILVALIHASKKHPKLQDTIVTLEELYKCYIETRNNKCYCGHTTTCACADLDITMFKEHLDNGNINFDADNGWKTIE